MNTRFLTLKYAGTLLIDQLISVLCSLVIISVLGFFLKDGRGTFLQNLLGFAFFAWIIYFDAWQKGSQDFNKIKLGYIRKSYLKGFLAGLLAALPNIFLATLAFFSENALISSRDFMGVGTISAIFRFWNLPLGMFLPFANETPAFNFIIPLFLPIFSGIGYIFGLNRISIKEIVVYKNDGE